jgi:hypothetical protein
MGKTSSRLSGKLLAVVLSTAALGGCGGIDGVELNGGIFDMMGVGTNSARSAEPVVPQRAGLVLPPQREVLPQPGSGIETAAVPNAQWPVDPEERKRQQSAEVRKQHDAYCAREIQRRRAMGDNSSIEGPLGRCDPSILRMFGSTGEVKEMREPGR